MYFGNLSNFFYKGKSWLYKQQKISIGSNKKNNILKIGKKYYIINSLTGSLKLIESSNNSQNTTQENNNKKENDNFPEIFSNKEIIRINNLFDNNTNNNNNNLKTNFANNSSFNKKTSIYCKTYDGKNQSNKKSNIIYNYNKTESSLLKNSNQYSKENLIFNEKGQSNNINLFNNNDNLNVSSDICESPLKLNIKYKKHNSIIIRHKKDIIKSKLKFQKYKKKEEYKSTENKILSKRNLKKLLEKRQKSADEKTNITTENNTNNNININEYEANNINKSYNNNKFNCKNINNNKLSIKDLNQFDLIKELFPNYKSLKIKKGDSWYLKTIKNQLFKDRISNNLKKQYQFYEDSENKRKSLEIPKINIKKNIFLNKFVIFPAKEPLHHKLYFEYVNKHKSKDNISYEIKYPILSNKKDYLYKKIAK